MDNPVQPGWFYRLEKVLLILFGLLFLPTLFWGVWFHHEGYGVDDLGSSFGEWLAIVFTPLVLAGIARVIKFIMGK